jgi:hypothetical protein
LAEQNCGQIKFQDMHPPAIQLQIRKFALTPLLRSPRRLQNKSLSPDHLATAGLEEFGLQKISRNTRQRLYSTQALPAPSSNFFIPNTLNPRCTGRTAR